MNNKVPLAQRFSRWAGGVVHGDLGQTIDNQSVNAEIRRRMWVSLRLVLVGAVVGTTLGVAAGAYGAVKQYQICDRLLTVFSFVILSIPAVVLGVLFKNAGIGIEQPARIRRRTELLYTTGEITPGIDPWTWSGILNRLAHLALPSLVLIVIAIAFYGRYQRNAMLDVLGQRLPPDRAGQGAAAAARAGQARPAHRADSDGHFFAYSFALLFVGAAFTEKIFGWHGMGEYFVDSVDQERHQLRRRRHAVRRRAGAARRVPVRRRLRGARPAGARVP